MRWDRRCQLLNGDLAKDLRPVRGDRQKGSRCTRGLAASVLPFMECAGRHAQHLRQIARVSFEPMIAI